MKVIVQTTYIINEKDKETRRNRKIREESKLVDRLESKSEDTAGRDLESNHSATT